MQGSYSASRASSVPDSPLVPSASFGGMSDSKVSSSLSLLGAEASMKLGMLGVTQARVIIGGSMSVPGSSRPSRPPSVAGSIVTAPRYSQAKVLAAGSPAVASASSLSNAVMHFPPTVSQHARFISDAPQQALGVPLAYGNHIAGTSVKPLAASRITSS